MMGEDKNNRKRKKKQTNKQTKQKNKQKQKTKTKNTATHKLRVVEWVALIRFLFGVFHH